MNFKKETDKATYTQEQYLAIDFMFILANESQLFYIQLDNKNKFKLVKTPRLDEFVKLNIYEKYVFLLEIFWTKYNFEEKIKVGYGITDIYELVYFMGQCNIDTSILKSSLKEGKSVFSTNASFVNILRILGLCDLELIDNVKSKYEDSIKVIKPTELGIEICKILSTKALKYFNFDLHIIELISKCFKMKKDKENKSFFEIIVEVFEMGLIEKNIKYKFEVNKKGAYTLKVLLNSNLWRVIKLSYNNTFHDLHEIIQKAFEFDDDHMYAFYTGTSYRNGKEFYVGNPMGVSEEYEELTIEEAGIFKGQQFIYLFDFGDMWEFKIRVLDFIENEEFHVDPEIIDSKGKSPQQYPSWD